MIWGSLAELKKLVLRVTKLTANVESLLDRVRSNEERLDRFRDEVSELKADLRVAKAELKSDAREAAVNTVLEMYEQMSIRVLQLEKELGVKQEPTQLNIVNDGDAS